MSNMTIRNYRAWETLYKIVMSYTEVYKVHNDEDVNKEQQLNFLRQARESAIKSVKDVLPDIEEEADSEEQKLVWKSQFDALMFNWGQADLYLHLQIVTILFGRYLLTVRDDPEDNQRAEDTGPMDGIDMHNIKQLAMGVLGHIYFIELSNIEYGIK